MEHRRTDDGFEEAFPRLFMTAYRVTRRLLGDPGDAEDAAAEVMARALVAWRRVGGQPHRDAWVARVATNLAIDRLRRGRAHPLPPVAPVPAAAADPAMDAVLRLALAAALAGLSRRQREVVVLRYLADLDEASVARSLGISVNSVKTHTLRGTAALRRRLGPSWPEVNLALD